MIRGTHHLTFCVGPAQEDYDFHVRLLGLRSIKKTVLFDGEIPIYHLYYGNRIGNLSTILTSFPYRQAGWMGRRGTNQLRTIRVSVPADSIGYWADRLRAAGVAIEDEDERAKKRAELMEEYAEGVDLLHLASELVIDAVIQPQDLRAELIRRFARYAGKRREWPSKRHGVTPV